MKLTKQQLKQLIKEELRKVLEGIGAPCNSDDDCDPGARCLGLSHGQEEGSCSQSEKEY